MQTCIHTVLNQIIPQRYVFILCFSSQYNNKLFTSTFVSEKDQSNKEEFLSKKTRAHTSMYCYMELNVLAPLPPLLIY